MQIIYLMKNYDLIFWAKTNNQITLRCSFRTRHQLFSAPFSNTLFSPKWGWYLVVPSPLCHCLLSTVKQSSMAMWSEKPVPQISWMFMFKPNVKTWSYAFIWGHYRVMWCIPHQKHQLDTSLEHVSLTTPFSLHVVSTSINDLKWNFAFGPTLSCQSTLHQATHSQSHAYTVVCRLWRQVNEVCCLRIQQYAHTGTNLPIIGQDTLYTSHESTDSLEADANFWLG